MTIESNNPKVELICILGPTASGKTSLATQLAYTINSVIISADSRQVYRNMDIGTGKDLKEFEVERKTIPYYLINIVDAGVKYNLFEYYRDFQTVFHSLPKSIPPILCGGSGLYIEAVLKGYQLQETPINTILRAELEKMSHEDLVSMLVSMKPLHNTSDIINRKRLVRAIEIEKYHNNNSKSTNDLSINSLVIGIDIDRDTRRQRITQRLKERLQQGMLDEVRNLINSGIPDEDLIYYGLEYKYLTLYLKERLSYHEMFEQLNTAIHQFAKRQMTWFRKMEKDGIKIHWLDWNLSKEEKINQCLEWLNQKNDKTS